MNELTSRAWHFGPETTQPTLRKLAEAMEIERIEQLQDEADSTRKVQRTDRTKVHAMDLGELIQLGET